MLTFVAKDSITKQIVLPKKLVDLISVKTKRLGITLPEYIRYLLIKDVEDLPEIPDDLPVEYIDDEQTLQDIKEALEDVKHGRTTTLRNKKEIEEYFKNLFKNTSK